MSGGNQPFPWREQQIKCFQSQQIFVTLVSCGAVFFLYILRLLGSLCLVHPLLVKCLSLSSFQTPFSSFLSLPYSCDPKVVLLNAVSFSKHPVRVPAECDYKAQFETSIDSAVEQKARLHIFFWSCPGKESLRVAGFLPSSRGNP